MKLKLFGLLSLLGVLLGACASDNEPVGNGAGEIKASFKANYQVRTSGSTESGTVNAATPDIENFMVHLKKSDGSYDKTWSSIATFPTDNKFITGAYLMEISYGSLDEEGFDKPYYYGSTTLNVEDEAQATPVIEATLANTMVKVNYTDAFKQYFSDYSTKIHSVGGEYIDFVKDETRAAYVKPGKITMQLTLTKTNGSQFTFEPAAIEKALPRTLYNITFDVNGGEVGAAVLKISFDDATVASPVNIVLSDDIVNAPAPYMTTSGYDSNTAINMVDGDDSPRNASCSILAHSGIGSIILTTESEYLLSIGWPAEIDLMKATDEQKALLTKYGLDVKGAWVNPDRMALVDFSHLLPNLRPFNGNSTHKFTLQVKDALTRVCENPVTLTVNAPAAVFALSNPESSEMGVTQASFTATYNSTNFKKNVTFKACNDQGEWVNAPIFSAELISENTYHVTVTVPNNVNAIKLVGSYRDISSSNEIVLPRTAPSFSLANTADYNTWARKTTVKIVPDNSDRLSIVTSNVKLYVQSGSGEYVVATSVTRYAETGEVEVAGLEPGTTYNIKASIDGVNFSSPVSVTTEAATQVPNAGMETWTSNKLLENGSDVSSNRYVYWKKWYPRESASTSEGWNTQNLTTTQDGGNAKGALGVAWPPYIGATYCANSGTIPTDDKYSGTYAALIRTVGWGSGSTGGGDESIVKRVTAGELYLGTYDISSHTPSYGYTFSSRPASLSFQYKYVPKNSLDYGLVEFVVKDASGNIIAKSQMNITAVSSYTKCTLALSYTVLAKAKSMYILFKSSNNSECLSANTTNLSMPPFGNLSDGESVGSKLYIDDITLNY